MADESDDCRDVVRYWEVLNEGWDAVFGSRFIRGGGVIDYPAHKLLLNRMANLFLRVLFRAPLNDFTNAFKAYRRRALDGCRPFLSPHFNLTVELPLKTIVRGYSWTVIPITWRNRRSGMSKLKIREMGSRYLFIALYCWLEKYFSRGDYAKDRIVESGFQHRARQVNRSKATVPWKRLRAPALQWRLHENHRHRGRRIHRLLFCAASASQSCA